MLILLLAAELVPLNVVALVEVWNCPDVLTPQRAAQLRLPGCCRWSGRCGAWYSWRWQRWG